LVPCGFCYQFYVTASGGLITKVTQRSSDIALAGGWNIASASLFTVMLASVSGLRPEKVIWSTGDTHIYLNQIDGVREQCSRKCDTPFPKLTLKEGAPSLENGRDITEFEFSHFELLDYSPQKRIKFAMNA
jgi:thymidylate synthase